MVSAITCVVAFKLYLPSASPSARPPWLIPTGLALTAIGLASTIALFDGFHVQYFPFQEHVEFFEQWFEKDFTHRPYL
jgi:hypothetical protein